MDEKLKFGLLKESFKRFDDRLLASNHRITIENIQAIRACMTCLYESLSLYDEFCEHFSDGELYESAKKLVGFYRDAVVRNIQNLTSNTGFLTYIYYNCLVRVFMGFGIRLGKDDDLEIFYNYLVSCSSRETQGGLSETELDHLIAEFFQLLEIRQDKMMPIDVGVRD